MTSIVQDLGTLALVGTDLGFFTFCVLFHVLADWRATDMGKHMMTFMVVCTTILTYAIVSPIFQPPEWFQMAMRLTFYVILAGVVWWRVRILIEVQRRSRKERDLSKL